MSGDLAARVGRLLMVGFEGCSAPPELLRRLRQGEVGGVIIFDRNIASLEQLSELLDALHCAVPADGRPPLLAVDQEGGRVQRVRAPLCEWPPMARLGELDDLALTEEVGRALGEDLRLLGFDLDFAPVLDVVNVVDDLSGHSVKNTVIGDRAFAADAARVAVHAVAFARGLAAAGILGCGKHFPGHGGPIADSHHTLPTDRRSEAALRARDLPPFRAAITAGVPLMMVAHVVYPALDPSGVPATFSPRICTELLRGELGFGGVTVSDDMEMGAITCQGSVDEACLEALRAGIDLLLVCRREDRQLAAYERLVRAARDEPAWAARFEQALARVESLPSSPVGTRAPADRVASVDAARHADLLARLR